MKKLTNNGLWGKLTIIFNIVIFISFILTVVFLLDLDKVNTERTILEPEYIEQTNAVNEAVQPYNRIDKNIEYYSAKLDSLKAVEKPKNRKEATALKDEITRISSELESYQRERADLDASVATLKADYETLEADYKKLEEQTKSKKRIYTLFLNLTFILLNIKIILFAIWNYKNLKNLRNAALWMREGHKPMWAWLGWIIPVYNMIKPFSVFSEVWEETDYILKDKELLEKKANSEDDFALEMWWALYLIAVLVCTTIINSTFFGSGAMFWKFNHTAVAAISAIIWCGYLLLESIIVKRYIKMNNILCENEVLFLFSNPK